MIRYIMLIITALLVIPFLLFDPSLLAVNSKLPTTYLTYMFAHANCAHLLGNMIVILSLTYTLYKRLNFGILRSYYIPLIIGVIVGSMLRDGVVGASAWAYSLVIFYFLYPICGYQSRVNNMKKHLLYLALSLALLIVSSFATNISATAHIASVFISAAFVLFDSALHRAR